MAASIICAPVVYPWYLLWLLPSVGSISTLPLVVWTISILPTYIVWHLRSLGQVWQLPKWVMPLEYGAFAVTSAIVLVLRCAKAAVLFPSKQMLATQGSGPSQISETSRDQTTTPEQAN